MRTSNHRHADLAVHDLWRWLLQRLEAFEGVAIFTSNVEGAFDPAFDPAFTRRLSMRLPFLVPDEAARRRLWARHVTPRTPTAGDVDFAELARRFPLSGGAIRQCALRAAFLAAHEARPLRQEHLLRAVQLECGDIARPSTLEPPRVTR